MTVRKTNLFYNGNSDVTNDFINFSNYTESLTGNFLSTNTKIYPSQFICLNIKNLNNANNRIKFINYIIEYYENKLAFIRDNIIDKNINIENKLLPLNYLIEAILNCCSYSDNELTLLNTMPDKYTEIKGRYTDAEIPAFFSDIVEQDYNGTFADTFCTIQSSDNLQTLSFKFKEISERESIDCADTTLHGWDNSLPPSFTSLSPIVDITIEDVKKYYVDSLLSSLNFKPNIDNKDISFNMIIPLYNVMNISKSEYSNILTEVNNNITIDLESTSLGTTFVPLGIYFSNDIITLKRNIDYQNPSWSLSILSQFKPFPYSAKMPQEQTVSDLKNVYTTFAEVLSKQNEMIDLFNNQANTINLLSNRINNIISFMKQTSLTQLSVDDYNIKLSNMQNTINKQQNNILALTSKVAELEENINNKYIVWSQS